MEVARYHRVSTTEQNPQRQLDSTRSYTDRVFPDSSDTVYVDKSTGTNTERDEYREMMNEIDAGAYDAVVVHSVSRLSRSVSDLQRIVSRLQESDTALHVVSEGFTFPADSDEIDPYQKALFDMLGTFAELEASMTRQRIKEGITSRQESDEYHHGPAPLGFEKEDGELYESPEYDQVIAVLDMVQKGNMSKREAAKRLGCARGTIRNALDRKELYGL